MVSTVGSPPPLATPSATGPFRPLDLDPAHLPPPEAPERWAFLQALRRGPLPLEAWLTAIEAGAVAPVADLLAALADHLDAPASLRLLRWWQASPDRDPGVPERILRHRDRAHAALLREAIVTLDAAAAAPADAARLEAAVTPDDHACAAGASSPATRLAVLLPLLGHQRCPTDFPLLSAMALEPRPTPVRRAALEGLLLGLGTWPRQPLRTTLERLAHDLEPRLAAAAIDGLARLPGCRPQLARLAAAPLDGALRARLQRRLRASPATPLLLLVHGRAGGRIPAELHDLAAELQGRRGAPVALHALSAGPLAALGPAELGPAEHGLALVPLLLLPGHHVRRDLAVIAAGLARRGPWRRWPFLGAWPLWQRALAEEARELAAAAGGAKPLLLHHPLEGELARRYLALLARRCAAECLPVPYSSATAAEAPLLIQRPVLPLTLASSRLSEALTPDLGPAAAAPLLARPRLRRALLSLLETLP
jgi:hypothetical protein